MIPFLLTAAAPCLLVLLGVGSALASGRQRLAFTLGGPLGAAAALLGLGVTITALATGGRVSFSAAWMQGIGGSFSLTLDPLAGFFLIPLYLLSAVSSVFGGKYLSLSDAGGRAGRSWLAFHGLTASMAMVILASNGVLFLAAWELMTISSWFLVTFEHHDAEARRAGLIYLVASHIGAAFLFALFLLLGSSADEVGAFSLDFSRFSGMPARAASAAFLLGMVGFGTKAGVIPLHIWLPEAHPAAPTHVSALMSGIMIKTGIYGIIRLLGFLGAPAPWWGWTLLGVGVVSGVLGVLYALAQRDIKRLLAYCSVENIGIICIGLGVGVLGVSTGLPAVALLGFGGGLLHVLNHALFKGLLFLGAGATARAAGSRNLEAMGGLMARMPATATLFLVGAAAICGLPPLNGFVGELLIFLGAFRAVASAGDAGATAGALALAGLGLVSGLAAACFARAFGVAFLGEPRTEGARAAGKVPALLVLPMAVLAAACAAIGLLGSLAVSLITPILAGFSGMTVAEAASLLSPAQATIHWATAISSSAVLLAAAGAGARALLLTRRKAERGPTWDCGYAKPGPTMQYTASSFASPLLSTFRTLVPRRKAGQAPTELFPSNASFASDAPDLFEHKVFVPGFLAVDKILARARWLQHGNLRMYVLYIALTLIALLVWNLV